MKLPAITIVRDSREHDNKGWVFDPEDKKPGRVQILGTEDGTLSAGDYTIKGLENIIVIERKYGLAELFGNMTPISNRDRFEREMQRMIDLGIKHKYILVESNISNDIFSMCPPQAKGPPSSGVMKWLIELGIKYNVHVMFVGDTGKRVSKMIFEQIAREYIK